MKGYDEHLDNYGNPGLFGTEVLSEAILSDISDEANRAHDMHGSQSMLYGDDNKSLRIMVEEVGECSREMNELALGNKGVESYNRDLRKELIQVSAMAATWVAKIDNRMNGRTQ